MLNGELVFVCILALPMMLALVLLKISCSGKQEAKGSVTASYWGTYTGAPQQNQHQSDRIKLLEPAVERDKNEARPAHAVFH